MKTQIIKMNIQLTSRVASSLLLVTWSTVCWPQLPQTVWASVFYGLTSPSNIDCAVDGLGNVVILGEFSGIADFDPGPSLFAMNSMDGNIFVVKLNTLGELVWAKQFGGSTTLTAGIEIDEAGNSFIAGNCYNLAADLDPGANVFNLPAIGGYLVKLNDVGNFVWARHLGGPILIVRALAIDSTGNPVVTGNFQGTIDFDPDVDTLNLSSAGIDDAFVSMQSSNGDLLWAAAIGGAGNEDGLAVATDGIGNIYVGGFYQDIADFDPGPGSLELTAGGGGDAYVCRLGLQGNLDWAVSMGGASPNFSDATGALTVSNGQLIAAGHFAGSGDFDPSAGSVILTSAGGSDVFVSRFSLDGVFNEVHQIGGWEGNEYCDRAIGTLAGGVVLSGTFQGSVDFDPGVADAILSTGMNGMFVCKWNELFEYEWAFAGKVKVVDMPNDEEVYCIGSCAAGEDVDPSTSIFQTVQSGALTMKLNQTFSTGLQEAAGNYSLTAHRISGTEQTWLVSFPGRSSEGRFKVIDMSGHSIQEGHIGQGSTAFTVDLSEHSIGLFIVEIIHGTERMTIRISRQ